MERFDNLSSWNIGFKGQEAFFRYRESGNLSPKNAGLALVISHTGLLAAVYFIPEQEQYVLTISGIRQYLLRKGGKSNPLRNEDINKQGRNR
jgi:hypothetical protein